MIDRGNMNRTNRSNFTSLSFTVEDDLISQASLTSHLPDRRFPKNPFSKDFEVMGGIDKSLDGYGQFQLSAQNKLEERIRNQAQRQAYKQLNNDLYNPFQHKLHSSFVPHQQNLYQKQKQRQIELLKKKQEEEINSNKNYTIVFHNNGGNHDKKSLKLTANNVLNEENFLIQDYYAKNIVKKRPIKQVDQKQEDALGENDEEQSSNPKHTLNKKAIKINLKQNNQIKQRTKIVQRKIESSHEISKKQKEASSFNSNKQIQSQKKTSVQKPKTSNQAKKPVNNFVNNIIKPQIKPKIPTPKDNHNAKMNHYQNLITKKQSQNSQEKKNYLEVYQGPDRNLVEQIQSQLAQRTNVTFEQIAELDNAKRLLQQAVLLPKLMPQFFKGIRKAMKGILMFGPPGTGKTLLAKAVANDNMFFNVSASSLASKWKGESQKMVRILFEMARYYAPSIIFFDEIDAIASKRSQNEHESSRKVKTELLVQMDGVQSSQQQIFVLAATNRPWDLDEALRRRLQKRIYIPLPEKQGRKKMFQIYLKEVKLSEKVNWDKVVSQTNGYSGADISNVCRDAAYMPMRKMLAKVGIKKIAEINEKQLLQQELSEKDLLEAIKNNKPSVNLDDLKRYEKWMKQFGSQ